MPAELVVRSKGFSISVNKNLHLPLSVAEQSVVRLTWGTLEGELDFSASFTPNGGTERTLLTARSARMDYADGAVLELEGAGLLSLSWAHWPGLSAYLLGGTQDVMLSYDIRLLTLNAQAALVKKEQMAARDARVEELQELEKSKREEAETLVAQATAYEESLEELRAKFALVEGAIAERKEAAAVATAELAEYTRERESLEAAGLQEGEFMMSALVAAIREELCTALGRDPTVDEVTEEVAAAVRTGLRQKLGREPTEEEMAGVILG